MSEERVLVYTKQPDHTGGCIFCDRAKQWLKEQNIPFQELTLSQEERQKLYSELGLQGRDATVPQIVVVDAEGTENRIGGYSELVSSGLAGLFA